MAGTHPQTQTSEGKLLLLEGAKRPSYQARGELAAKGIQVTQVQELAACLPILDGDRSHVVLIDLDFYRSGIEAIEKIRSLFPDTPVIAMAALERLAVVDEALRAGAWDFVVKQPDLSHLQEIPYVLARNTERKRLKFENDRYRDEAARLQAETELYQEEAKKLRAESERHRVDGERLQAETDRGRDEVRRLQAEVERHLEEIAKLQQESEKSRQGSGASPAPGESGRRDTEALPAESARPRREGGDEVLADIAEDLKSPLAAMIGYLEIASGITAKRAEESQLLSIKRTDALARRLFDLVMNHTEALDIEAGKFELQKSVFQINDILDLAVQDKQGEASMKNIDLVFEKAPDLPPVSADLVQIERAVKILIGNAIHLSPSGSTVAVSSRLKGREIAIAVKDSGAGIFEEEIPLLFDRRKKLRRRGAEVNTTGLFVARHIVDAHGGRIDVQSDPREGTTMTISLSV